jgi:drug/metabolite transporter (DMT)-like permease
LNNLTDQQKGSLLAFVAVMFITPDSLFIRLSNIDTWGLVFYRGIIPFVTVLLGMLLIYKLNFFKMLFTSGNHGIIYILTFSLTNITFVVSIQNTNVANTLVMIAMAPMLSAILGAIFLKELPDKKTWIAIFVTFGAAVYIFYDSLKLGNFFGDILGLITALGLAIGAVTIRSAKNKNLVPAAVVGKLIVALFALFFIESFTLTKSDQIIVPLMCIMCVGYTFCFSNNCSKIYTSSRGKFILFIGNYYRTDLGLASYSRTTKYRDYSRWSCYYNSYCNPLIYQIKKFIDPSQ